MIENNRKTGCPRECWRDPWVGSLCFECPWCHGFTSQSHPGECIHRVPMVWVQKMDGGYWETGACEPCKVAEAAEEARMEAALDECIRRRLERH